MIQSQIYCFIANYHTSRSFDVYAAPEWLTIESNWRGYRIVINPWIADVARVLGLLAIDDSRQDWQIYLESLGFRDLVAVTVEDFYEDKLYGF